MLKLDHTPLWFSIAIFDDNLFEVPLEKKWNHVEVYEGVLQTSLVIEHARSSLRPFSHHVEAKAYAWSSSSSHHKVRWFLSMVGLGEGWFGTREEIKGTNNMDVDLNIYY